MSLPVVIVCRRGAIFEIARRTTGTGSTTDKTDWSVGHRVSCSPIVVDSTRNSHIRMYVRTNVRMNVRTYYVRTGYVARPRSCLLEMQYASASARTDRARRNIRRSGNAFSRAVDAKWEKGAEYGLPSYFFVLFFPLLPFFSSESAFPFSQNCDVTSNARATKLPRAERATCFATDSRINILPYKDRRENFESA